MASPTPYHQLLQTMRQDGARPLVTFYDDSTGERVELSVTTFDNWVTKTVGLLTEGLDLEPGSVCKVLLPSHWQTLVWACACWTTGVELALGPLRIDEEMPDAIVTGPVDIESISANAGTAPVVACSLRPLGGRFVEPLPDGVFDYAVEAPTYPDQLVMPPEADPAAPAMRADGVSTTAGGLVQRGADRAAELGLSSGERVLVAADEPAPALLDALLVPLAVDGSAVLVRHADPASMAQRSEQEHVDLQLPA